VGFRPVRHGKGGFLRRNERPRYEQKDRPAHDKNGEFVHARIVMDFIAPVPAANYTLDENFALKRRIDEKSVCHKTPSSYFA